MTLLDLLGSCALRLETCLRHDVRDLRITCDLKSVICSHLCCSQPVILSSTGLIICGQVCYLFLHSSCANGWNEAALITAFRQGLSSNLFIYDDAMGLENIIQCSFPSAAPAPAYASGFFSFRPLGTTAMNSKYSLLVLWIGWSFNSSHKLFSIRAQLETLSSRTFSTTSGSRNSPSDKP